MQHVMRSEMHRRAGRPLPLLPSLFSAGRGQPSHIKQQREGRLCWRSNQWTQIKMLWDVTKKVIAGPEQTWPLHPSAWTWTTVRQCCCRPPKLPVFVLFCQADMKNSTQSLPLCRAPQFSRCCHLQLHGRCHHSQCHLPTHHHQTSTWMALWTLSKAGPLGDAWHFGFQFKSCHLSDSRMFFLRMSSMKWWIYIYTYIHTYIHTYLHYITLHCITFHYITLHYTKLHCISLHVTLYYTTLHYITSHYMYTYI